MKALLFVAVAAFCAQSVVSVDTCEHNKIVCYWNSTAYERRGLGKFQLEDVRPALSHCTHLIYSSAGIDAGTKEVISLNPYLDNQDGQGYYEQIIKLKESFPWLKIYLGINSYDDPIKAEVRYQTVIDTPEARSKIINSILKLLDNYDFDGIDLAWKFPSRSFEDLRSVLEKTRSMLYHGNLNISSWIPNDQGYFTAMVRDLKTQLTPKQKALTVTVLPDVLSHVHLDVKQLVPNIDAVHLLTCDLVSPKLSPKEVGYPSPIANISATAKYWLEKGTPATKIVVGIPTYGRTWRLISHSRFLGITNVTADGSGAAGPQTNIPGLRSYAEVCFGMLQCAVDRLVRVADPSKMLGTYAFRAYDENTGVEGIWVGYEDPDTAGYKAAYVKENGLGGVAIYDLSLDDFRGLCTGEKFPIMGGAKRTLGCGIKG